MLWTQERLRQAPTLRSPHGGRAETQRQRQPWSPHHCPPSHPRGLSPQAHPCVPPSISPAAAQRQFASSRRPSRISTAGRSWGGGGSVVPSSVLHQTLPAQSLPAPISERQALGACCPSLTPDTLVTRPGPSSLRFRPGCQFHLSPLSAGMKASPAHRANLSDCCEAAAPLPLLEE